MEGKLTIASSHGILNPYRAEGVVTILLKQYNRLNRVVI